VRSVSIRACPLAKASLTSGCGRNPYSNAMNAQQPIRLHHHAAYSRQSKVQRLFDGIGDPRAVASPPSRPGGRIGKGLLAGVLLIGAFQAGRFLPHRAETAPPAQPPATIAGPAVTNGSAAAEIPPAFRAQMAQPPQLIPPPGGAAPGSGSGAATPSAAPAASNPFGLQG